MLKKILNVVKKIIMAVLLIYAYNIMGLPINVMIPINIITVLIASILGLPGILSLIVFSLLFL